MPRPSSCSGLTVLRGGDSGCSIMVADTFTVAVSIYKCNWLIDNFACSARKRSFCGMSHFCDFVIRYRRWNWSSEPLMFRRYKMYAYLRRPRLLNLKEVYCENRFLPSQKDNGRDRNKLKSSLGRPFLVYSLSGCGRSGSNCGETELSHRGWYQANYNLRLYQPGQNQDVTKESCI